jgi:D-inositol-3-phosphate glycosyltransferase
MREWPGRASASVRNTPTVPKGQTELSARTPARLLLVTAYFRPHVGGIERFVEILAGGLADRGHDVTVLCCRTERESPLFEEVDGYVIERVPASNRPERHLGVPYPCPRPLKLRRALERLLSRVDVVHVQDALYASSVAALVLSRRRGVPSVLTQHVGFVPQRTRWLDALEQAAIATLGRSARLATLVATLNPAVARWVETRWGIRDVRVLPVGIPSVTNRARDCAAVRRSFGLSPDRFLALFVGRDVPKKGLDVFLAAADTNYELVAITDRPREGRATFLPFTSPGRFQELLSCVDAFVLPSEGEGFPISLQEALANGLPVVTTRQPGYDHYLSADDVLYVERHPEAVRRALRRLVEGEELRLRLSERARAAAERHFGMERFIDAYEEVYEEARGRLDASPPLTSTSR